MPKKTIKTYTEMDNLKRAIKKAGLHLIKYRVEETSVIGPLGRERVVYKPVFQCELPEDVTELQSREWAAEKLAA